ncbi:PP2C family protein-serine/threonine phosphatase [Nocardiopsis sp. LOL_012]|uniref:PP2C family protein-serine/threonine phosphatase n=1 Tax=Nocardiopsis sp. LOL_012 TaxID=3345409 RepID=UPI003A856293
MTKVRTCPACSDRVAAGDAFCEGCGRTLPGEIRDAPAESPGAAITAPQVSLSGSVGDAAGDRPGLAPDEGAPTAPQVSLAGGASVRDEDATVTRDLWRGPADGAPAASADPAVCVWCPGRVRDGYCDACERLQPTGRDHVAVRVPGAVGVSDRGLRHKRNEDAMAVRVLDTGAPGTVVAVVCDGVSSSPRPDEASRVTAETGAEVLAERVRRGEDPREATGAAMVEAAQAVAAIAESPGSAPACTFVSAVVRPDTGEVTVGWVGDSRAYWVSDGPGSSASALLTKDDSWSEAMVEAGVLSREEAMRSANAHALVAWMGADSGKVDAHISTVTPSGPGAVVLCSDGLWNYYPEAEKLAAAAPGAATAPEATARRYVDLALAAGGKDNITVVVVPVPEGWGRPGGREH